MIACPAMLDVPRELVEYVSRLLAARRVVVGTRPGTRILSPFDQALFVLVWMRKNEDVQVLGAGFGLSRATSCRYRDEGITVIAEQAPDLHEALERAAAEGIGYLVLDGKVFAADRCAEKAISVRGEQIDRWYSGKTHGQGGNIQALTDPRGIPLWVSDVEPGSVHDSTAARKHVLGALYWAASRLGVVTLADGGYDGVGIGVRTPIKQPVGDRLAPDNRAYNALLRGLRAPGERGFALLTRRWKVLRRLTVSPERIGDVVKAGLVLTQFEHRMIA